MVTTSTGEPVIAQIRAAQRWADGSIRWLHLLFEAQKGPGDYLLKPGQQKEAPNLLNASEARIVVDTGRVSLIFPQSEGTVVKGVSAQAADGKSVEIISENPALDLIMIRQDGKVFKAAVSDNSRRLVVEERGPVRASVRCEGKLRSADGETLFDYIWRWQAYRDRGEIVAALTWINAVDTPGVLVKDIRITLPFQFPPTRLVFGCERGVYDGPFLKDFPVFILQEDHNRYWALTRNPDGRLQHLSSGGCDGEHCPGWVSLQNENRALAVWVPNFWQEYPNEIAVKEGEVGIGLWPERAAAYLSSKPILPPDPDGKGRYRHPRYWPVMPHPYLAFFDGETKCLDVPRGLAKTQEIVLSVWAGRDGKPNFEKKWWAGSLRPVRAVVDPAQVAKSQACGPLWPRDPQHFPEAERVFDESFDWFRRHVEVLKCYGKFDYGDFRYFIPSTTYMCHPGTKWGQMGEMPREGYWHNNERDPLRGVLLYYLRSGRPEAWELCRNMARHALDVDICHYPRWGMYPHSYGHCYLGADLQGAADHSWLLGLLEWAGVSGDPLVWEWVLKCGEALAANNADFARTDCRTTAMQLHMMTQFYRYTGDSKYLEAARRPAEALIRLQKPDGSWAAYLGEPEKPHGGSFPEHAIMALADYFDATGDERVLPVLRKALTWAFPESGKRVAGMVSEAPLSLVGVAVMGEHTGEATFAEIAENVFRLLDTTQNRSPDLIARGDWWATYEVHNAPEAKDSDRPPQFCYQSRPLAPATVLAYAPRCLWLLAKQRGWRLP